MINDPGLPGIFLVLALTVPHPGNSQPQANLGPVSIPFIIQPVLHDYHVIQTVVTFWTLIAFFQLNFNVKTDKLALAHLLPICGVLLQKIIEPSKLAPP